MAFELLIGDAQRLNDSQLTLRIDHNVCGPTTRAIDLRRDEIALVSEKR